MREVERRTGILERFAGCFTDHRAGYRIEHSVPELVAQRVYALALGYEDLNDHNHVRADPLLTVLRPAGTTQDISLLALAAILRTSDTVTSRSPSSRRPQLLS